MKLEIKVKRTKDSQTLTPEMLGARMESAMQKAILQMESAAKRNLRGDPRGKHLMSSINTDVRVEGLHATGRVGVGTATGIDDEGASEMFAIYVHEGTGIYSRTGMGRQDVPWLYPKKDKNGETTLALTSGMQPNPFLEDAYNSDGEKCKRIFASELRRG